MSKSTILTIVHVLITHRKLRLTVGEVISKAYDGDGHDTAILSFIVRQVRRYPTSGLLVTIGVV